jgi:hypothetical protein
VIAGNGRPLLKLLAGAVVLSLGVQVFYLFIRYILGSTGTQRFHVESWALIFVACGLIFRLARSRRPESDAGSAPFPSWTWFVFCGLAIALYWRALSVGFLSDDFVLVTHASNWNLGAVTPALFRPIPLFIWAVLLQAGAGATILHIFNVLLHGTNAYLTARIVEGWVKDRRWSMLAGLLVLTAPLAPEAVVWLSGVFDLLATTLVLTCVLLARRYDNQPSMATRIQFVAVGIAAVASKETAAVAGGLVLLDAWARNARSRQLLVDTGILIVTVGVFSLVRLGAAFGMNAPPVDRYMMQRALFGTVGGLAVPWHIDVIARLPWLPILGVATLLYLLLTFFLEREGSKLRTRLAIAAAVWTLIPIVPVFPILFVAPDLQQSRYLYMSAAGWAGLIAAVASQQRRALLRRVSLAAVGVLIAIDSFGTLMHLRPWNEAAVMREKVERSALVAGTGCPTITLSNLPDSVRGAYVFRNGGAEAFARDLHLNAVLGDAGGQCSFRWSDTRLSFVPVGATRPGS